MIYDIQINGQWVRPTDERHWGLDTFEGRHIIPKGRDLIAENVWGPGVNVIPGPPQSSFFKWGFWVEGDGSNVQLEARLRELLAFFVRTRHRRNFEVLWDDPAFTWYYHTHARITSLDVVYNTDRTAARVNVVLENLSGTWRENTFTTKSSQNFGGTAITVNEGDDVIYDSVIEVEGPCSAPTFAITPEPGQPTRWLKYSGAIGDGQILQIRCSPIQATLNGTPVNQFLTWWGSEGRAFDLLPGDHINCTATGVNAGSGSRWAITYRNIRF